MYRLRGEPGICQILGDFQDEKHFCIVMVGGAGYRGCCTACRAPGQCSPGMLLHQAQERRFPPRQDSAGSPA